MNQMVDVGPHSIRVAPEAFDQMAAYARHFIRDTEALIAAYQAEQAHSRSDGLRLIVEGDAAVIEARREIARAEAFLNDVDRLRGEIEVIYRWHYEQLAEVFRAARRELGFDRLDHSPHLHFVVMLTMAMLKAENSKFSEEKFINYINN